MSQACSIKIVSHGVHVDIRAWFDAIRAPQRIMRISLNLGHLENSWKHNALWTLGKWRSAPWGAWRKYTAARARPWEALSQPLDPRTLIYSLGEGRMQKMHVFPSVCPLCVASRIQQAQLSSTYFWTVLWILKWQTAKRIRGLKLTAVAWKDSVQFNMLADTFRLFFCGMHTTRHFARVSDTLVSWFSLRVLFVAYPWDARSPDELCSSLLFQARSHKRPTHPRHHLLSNFVDSDLVHHFCDLFSMDAGFTWAANILLSMATSITLLLVNF